MSASNKKKIRKEQEAELLTQRQQQEQKEAKKLKLITTAFIAGLVLILAVFIGIMIADSINSAGTIGNWTTVATVGDHKLSLTEFNYYYADAVSEVGSEMYSVTEYADSMDMTPNEVIQQIYDVDVTKPLTQLTNIQTGKNYADELVEKALNDAARDYALYDAAKAAGFTLSAEDQEIVNNLPRNLETYAMINGFMDPNTNAPLTQLFLREGQRYGKYATVKSFLAYQERSLIADSYYTYYTEQLTYDDAALRNAEGETPEDYNSYSYAYYTVKTEDFLTGGTTAEDGTVTYSAEEKEAARAAAETAANGLTSATTIEEFDDKVAHLFTEETTEEATEETEETAETEPAEKTEETEKTEPAEETETESTEDEIDIPLDTEEGVIEEENLDGESHEGEHEQTTKSMDVLHTGAKEDFREWLAAETTVKGSTTVIPVKGENDEITGYNVVYLMAKTDNKKAPVNVRHILVEVTDTENEEAWATALTEAEALVAEYEAGEKTEESFTAMVHDNTDDTGSAETGGLYEDVRPTSSYVDGFLDWCIADERKAGDVDIVKTEYGYHVMYFVEHQEQSYRDQMISDKLRAADASTWETGLIAQYAPVQKNMKKIDKDIISFYRGY